MNAALAAHVGDHGECQGLRTWHQAWRSPMELRALACQPWMRPIGTVIGHSRWWRGTVQSDRRRMDRAWALAHELVHGDLVEAGERFVDEFGDDAVCGTP